MNDTLSIINPATETLIETIPSDDRTMVQLKAAAALSAQPAWATRPLSERVAAIERFQTLLREQQADLAATLTAETGKPITQAKAEIHAASERIAFFTRHASPDPGSPGRSRDRHSRHGRLGRSYHL